jgi:hypothetical protein
MLLKRLIDTMPYYYLTFSVTPAEENLLCAPQFFFTIHTSCFFAYVIPVYHIAVCSNTLVLDWRIVFSVKR